MTDNTKRQVLTSQLQRSSVTCEDRHRTLLVKAYAAFRLENAKVLCSYGASSGEEIRSLITLFPEYHQIIGVEINEQKRSEAKAKFKNERRVKMLSPEEFYQLDTRFDFITALNVFCNFNGSVQLPPLEFAVFCQSITDLSHFLSPGGVLCVYGANYRVNEVPLPSPEFTFEPFQINSGPVPIYCGKTGARLTRSNQLTSIVRRQILQEDDVKTTDVIVPITTNEIVKVMLPTPSAPEPTNQFQVRQEVEVLTPSTQTVVWGILHPGKTSNNIGDYMQTLAQLNVLATFYRPEWECTAGMRHVLETFQQCKPSGDCARQTQHANHVKLVWFDRDASSADEYKEEEDGKQEHIHVIANGWFMHPKSGNGTKKRFAFPFAANIDPIFVSMHIATPELLDDEEVCSYLRKHSPIGCRDLATCQLMRKHNILAYFSSCLTTSLELPGEDCYVKGEILQVDVLSCNATHHLPRLADTMTPDDAIQVAMRQLTRYAHAVSIDSMRIHCLLPVRAVSDKPRLTFCSKTGGQDATWMNRDRFSGLIECMENESVREIRAMVLFEYLTNLVHNILFESGVMLFDPVPERSCIDISAISKLSYPTRYLRMQHPQAIRCKLDGLVAATLMQSNHYDIERLPVTPRVSDFLLRRCTLLPFTRVMDIFVTFDQNYEAIFTPFLTHLAHANQSLLLRMHCATRGVPTLKLFKVPQNVVLYHYPLDTAISFAHYTSPLKHVSNACMDRLLVPLLEAQLQGLVLERVIYMDLDICVIGSLAPLLDMDTGKKGIIAKTSLVPHVINSWIAKYEKARNANVDLATVLHYPHTRSFNAGVLVMDMSKLKMYNMWESCKKMYEETGYNDQILLNFYADGEYKELPAKFNIFVGQDHTQFTTLGHQKAVAYHYVGSQKPWCFEDVTKYPDGPEVWQLWHNVPAVY
jgi:lipopolysaccharide biosynthesis glycosyltransferase